MKAPGIAILRHKVPLLVVLSVASILVAVVSVVINVEGHAISLATRYVWAWHLLSAGPGFAFLAAGLGWLALLEYRDADAAARLAQTTIVGLEAFEDRYRGLVEMSPDAIFVQTEGRFVYANPAALALFGAQRSQDLIGSSVIERIEPASRETVSGHIKAFSEPHGDPIRLREQKPRYLRLDGTIVDVDVAAVSTVFDGRPGAQVIARDMTEAVSEQKAIARYRLLAESAGDIVFFIQEDGRFVDVNRAAERAYGYTRGELLAMNVADIRDPGHLAPLRAQIDSALAGGIRFETQHVRKDGTPFDVEVDSRSADIGGSRLVVSVCRDITARRQAEDSLRDSEQRYRGMIESLPVPMLLIDRAGAIRFANAAADRLLATAPLVGSPVQQLLPDSATPEIVRHVAQTAAGHATRIEEVTIRCGDGSSIDVDVIVSSNTLDGEPVYQVMLQPVSERKQTELALRRSLTDTIHAMAQMVEARDPYTAGHQNRVQHIAVAIARELGLDFERVTAVKLAAMVHDLGKINIPAEILSRPGQLSSQEFALIKTHSQHGYDIVKDIPFPWPIADIVLQHHERMDGTGYPQGLMGDDICLEARIVGVADVVEAVASHRPYRPSLGLEAALGIIREGSGMVFDADVVEACVRVVSSDASSLGLDVA